MHLDSVERRLDSIQRDRQRRQENDQFQPTQKCKQDQLTTAHVCAPAVSIAPTRLTFARMPSVADLILAVPSSSGPAAATTASSSLTAAVVSTIPTADGSVSFSRRFTSR